MKALTIWQPYASLIVADKKGFETRSWATSYRGPLAIHAARKSVRSILNNLSPITVNAMRDALQRSLLDLPTGAVIGTVDLVDCWEIDEQFLRSLTARERAFGDCRIGRFAWELANPKMFIHPQYTNGAQGLWNWAR